MSTSSTMLPLNTVAPDFTLPDTVSGKTLSLSDIASDKATVVMFICNHCPYVVHVREELVRLANDYIPRGAAFIAIGSNDATAYPDDAPEMMKEHAERFGYPFPYLYDESQDVARAYGAACTPDFYLFDGSMRCRYRGQLDASRPGSATPVTGHDLRAALDAVLTGTPVHPDQTPSIGCGIKWKREGN